SEGRLEPLERCGRVEGGLFLAGCVLPLLQAGGGAGAGAVKGGGGKGGKGSREAAVRQQGRLVSNIGPITSWRVRYSPDQEPKLLICTALAQYECGKPTVPYRKLLSELLTRVELAGAVHRALCPEAGGRLDAGYNEVCCAVARNKISKQYGGSGYALKLNGRFILEQLAAMACSSGPAPTSAATVAGNTTAAATTAAAAAAGDKGKGPADKGKGPADKGKGPAAGGCSYDNGPFAAGLRAAM
ncbi:hypothetical protein Agub_g7561, partial [Astrephomene gubernaculifera]